MATSVKITSKLPDFAKSVDRTISDALNEVARDILTDAKNKAPFEKGGLRSNSKVEKREGHTRAIVFDIEYAAFQEFGGDSKRTVRKYTTGGTGKHYLKNAGEEQKNKFTGKIKKHTDRIRV